MDFFLNEAILSEDELQIYFSQMFGLEKHTPFECVGQPENSLVAMFLIYHRKFKGKAVDLFTNMKISKERLQECIEEVYSIDTENNLYPAELKESILTVQKDCAKLGKDYIYSLIK